jgi:hypothetical protein
MCVIKKPQKGPYVPVGNYRKINEWIVSCCIQFWFPLFPDISLMYSKANLKINGDKVSPLFWKCWMGSDRICLPLRALLQVSFISYKALKQSILKSEELDPKRATDQLMQRCQEALTESGSAVRSSIVWNSCHPFIPVTIETENESRVVTMATGMLEAARPTNKENGGRLENGKSKPTRQGNL